MAPVFTRIFDSPLLNVIGDTLRTQSFGETLSILKQLERSKNIPHREHLKKNGEGVRRQMVAFLLDAPNMPASHDVDSIEKGHAAVACWLRLAPPDSPGIDSLLEEVESFLEMETNEKKRLSPECARGLERFLTELTRHGFDPEQPPAIFHNCMAFEDVQCWYAGHRANILDGVLPASGAQGPRMRL